MANLKSIPKNLKSIQPYLKIADEHEKRDLAITYWGRFYAVQTGLKLNDKSPENSSFFLTLMDWLEKVKKSNLENEVITNDIVAQAHIENYALKLFLWADNEDRAGRFNKNVVKAFYTAGFLYDIVNIFGEYTEEVLHHRKYAKWKATYIHNCLKNGIMPTPGPMALENEDGEDELSNLTSDGTQVNDNPAPNTTYPYNLPTFQNDGFVIPVPGAHAPPSTPNGSSQVSPSNTVNEFSIPAETKGEFQLRPEDFHKAQKYCKWAGSALQYEDVPTAVENLKKALQLLTTGTDE